MRKRHKKLQINRETLRLLGTRTLWRAVGGIERAKEINWNHSGEDTCGLCDSIASCSELAEDCCVTTVE